MLACLNAGLVARETFAGSAPGRLRWLLAGCPPFVRAGLAEIPFYAPLDCDLLGLPAPQQDTAPYLLAYARCGAARRGVPASGGRDDYLPRLDYRRR